MMLFILFFFFFNDTATTEIYTLSLHDALPICPWNKTASSPVGFPEIYPDYSVAAQVLLNAGVPPDFQADGTIRYIHRRDNGTNLYFVASRTNVLRTVQCQFRVTGLQPEWWNPATGECRLLPNFTQTNGITTIPLQFAPYESAFIVFQT